jgi:hypothetical protein
MEMAKPNGSAEINKSSELDFTGKLHDLTRSRGISGRAENSDGGKSAYDLGTLVRRVSEASHREIDNLMGELQALDKKLQTDGDWIQHHIEEYAGLSQQFMQLTTIISDSVKQLPKTGSLDR